MTAHIVNDLPRMLTGEATRDEVLTGAAHLRQCIDCQQELVSAVVAHASLTSAQRFAPEVVSGIGDDFFTGPGDDGDGGDDPDNPHLEDETVSGQPERPTPPLPDLSAVFSQVRKEAGAPQPTRHPRRGYLIAAAAAVVILGGGAALYAATSGSDSGTSTNTIELAAYDKGTTRASATLSGDHLKIDAAALPEMSGERYEVWLTNSGRTEMQPIGWLGPDGTASMTVPSDLLQRFSDIEVSVQSIQAKDYAYSGTSVLRGDYE